MWGRRYYLDEIGNDFVNAFSLLKKIERRGDNLAFVPISLERYYKNVAKESYTLNGVRGYGESHSSHYRIRFKKDKGLSVTFKIKGTSLVVDCDDDKYTLDRRETQVPLGGVDPSSSKDGLRYLRKKMPEELCFDFYLDGANIEVYFDDFEESFSFLDFSSNSSFSIRSTKPVDIEADRADIEVK